MAAWRILGTLVVLLAAVGSGSAQTYSLTETVQAGDCFRLHLEMNLTGEMKNKRDGKDVPLRMKTLAIHDFPERVLSVAKDMPDKVARIYEKAQVVMAVERERSERGLRPERRLFVVQRRDDRPFAYCTAGPLTREELDVTEHLDTLSLTGLLPGKVVAVGETWKVPNTVAQALCNFEGLTAQDLVCKLAAVQDDVARVSITGTANGIDLGALAKLTVDATYQFDLKAKRLTALEWKQQDERGKGPASPATTLETVTRVTRTVIDQPMALNNVALVSVPEGEIPLPLTQLEFREPRAGYTLLYGREWQMVSQSKDHVVMRLMDRGDFVAQVTITPWTQAEEGKHLSADEFRQAMTDTPGWEPQMELQAGEVPSDGGRWIYRISATGKLDDTSVMQNFYLVAGPDGRQVVLAFTLTPKQADRLGTRDLTLAANLNFLPALRETVKPKD